jgi:hypothetical protein
MHETVDSPATEQDREQTHSQYTDFQVVNAVGEPVGPRHDTEPDAELWASNEFGRLPAGFSVEPVPEQTDTDDEQSSERTIRLSGHGAVATLAAAATATAATGSATVGVTALVGGVVSLVGTALWHSHSETSEGEA